VVAYQGDCLDSVKRISNETVQLVVTSPPYNLGKEYERKLKLDQYLQQQKSVICEWVRILKKSVSICWQIGNYSDNGSIIPLDTVLYQSLRV
jgi:DNA modification methylase